MTNLPTPYAAARIAAFLSEHCAGRSSGTNERGCGALPRTTPILTSMSKAPTPIS